MSKVNFAVFCLVLFVYAISLPDMMLAQDYSSQIPDEVSAIVGTYAGSWTNFGIDDKGQVVKKATWTDTIRAENPVATEDRAYVTITDEMFFEGGMVPPMKMQGTEGYFLNPDGSTGDYFFEMYGHVFRMQKLAEDTWVYALPADPGELAQLGFSNILFAQHVQIKVVTDEQGIETHRISRLTTVNWEDAKGKDHWLQYVSLQGFHERLH